MLIGAENSNSHRLKIRKQRTEYKYRKDRLPGVSDTRYPNKNKKYFKLYGSINTLHLHQNNVCTAVIH